MPKYEIEVGAVITQTIDIDADSLETAKEWAMDLFRMQLADYDLDAKFGSNAQHSPFEVNDYEFFQANGSTRPPIHLYWSFVFEG